MRLSTEARVAIVTIACCVAVVAIALAAYEIGLRDARLDIPLVCGDALHPDGVHRVPVRLP